MTLNRFRFKTMGRVYRVQSESPTQSVSEIKCEIVALLARFIGPDLWPPTSPDLNPVNYQVWGLMQEHMYKSPIKDVSELKQRLIEAWSAMRQRVIDEAIDQWRKLRCSVSAEGGHFEHKL